MKRATFKQETENLALRTVKILHQNLKRDIKDALRVADIYREQHDDYELSTSKVYEALVCTCAKMDVAIDMIEQKLGINQTTK